MSALDDAVRWQRDHDAHVHAGVHDSDADDFNHDLHEEVAHELDVEAVSLLKRAVDEETARRAGEPRHVLDSKMGAWERVGPDAYTRVSWVDEEARPRRTFLEIARHYGIRHCN